MAADSLFAPGIVGDIRYDDAGNGLGVPDKRARGRSFARLCHADGQGCHALRPHGRQVLKPVSAPTSQTDDDSGRPHVFAAADHVSFSFAFVAPIANATPFVVPSVEAFEAPAVRSYLARFANSPPPLWTQFRSPSLAGRAPPVL